MVGAMRILTTRESFLVLDWTYWNSKTLAMEALRIYFWKFKKKRQAWCKRPIVTRQDILSVISIEKNLVLGFVVESWKRSIGHIFLLMIGLTYKGNRSTLDWMDRTKDTESFLHYYILLQMSLKESRSQLF